MQQRAHLPKDGPDARGPLISHFSAAHRQELNTSAAAWLPRARLPSFCGGDIMSDRQRRSFGSVLVAKLPKKGNRAGALGRWRLLIGQVDPRRGPCRSLSAGTPACLAFVPDILGNACNPRTIKDHGLPDRAGVGAQSRMPCSCNGLLWRIYRSISRESLTNFLLKRLSFPAKKQQSLLKAPVV